MIGFDCYGDIPDTSARQNLSIYGNMFKTTLIWSDMTSMKNVPWSTVKSSPPLRTIQFFPRTIMHEQMQCRMSRKYLNCISQSAKGIHKIVHAVWENSKNITSIFRAWHKRIEARSRVIDSVQFCSGMHCGRWSGCVVGFMEAGFVKLA